ncbi:hypothetical protein LTR56_021743 [Elasticomyces elasticus]|nr:hypothetical protein LTR56_021743 [Elasticomyces elasticus]KAK3630699.1 hypothetical protein LTR22_021394 [Elasticomyces elasticus]KAK4909119.1 hypothetical protein LTR49_022090 [Elasticomyces elasticus]KAK5749258.1 hypothetical protein LTS12_020700 [Elasticomyces elasticus]
MAELPFFSSQASIYDSHAITDQENLASSPPPNLRSSSLKQRKPPTVTPKRFTKFFTPRPTSSSVRGGGRQSKAGRQLRDITKNGANQRRRGEVLVQDDMLRHLQADELAVGRPVKRRKVLEEERVDLGLSSSPPQLQSSPLKRVQFAGQIDILEDEPASPSLTASDADDELPGLLEALQPFPTPIRRLRGSNDPTKRVLERSFGGQPALSQGYRGSQHCASWQSSTANFVSTPSDVHSFRPGTAIPFCTTPCHTNSLIAIGDEEGSVRLLDTSPSTSFSTTHLNIRVHRNAVMDLAFSSDDYLLATASGDQTSRVVDMHTQSILCVLSGHGSSVKQVRFQPNAGNNVLTTSSRDGTVQIWDLRCSERGSMSTLRIGQRKGMNEDGHAEEPSIRYPRSSLRVGPAHRSTKGTGTKSPSTQNSEESAVSITAIEHLPHGREHLLVTASELSASVKLWDLRNAGRRGDPVPLASTPLPSSHRRTRNYGVSSLALSGDGARLYTLCKDATIYAYSTNHLIMGHAPEMSERSNGRRRTVKEPKIGLGPLYGLRHEGLTTGSFYVKLAVRPEKGDRGEVLAVGSGSGTPVLFPTYERHFPRRRQHDPSSSPASDDDEEGEDDLPSPPPRTKSVVGETSNLPIYEQGTALIRGHESDREVTAVTWTHDGDLVTVGDDFTARCWREDGEGVRALRGCGEGGGRRWGSGWADVGRGWDDVDC